MKEIFQGKQYDTEMSTYRDIGESEFAVDMMGFHMHQRKLCTKQGKMRWCIHKIFVI